MTCCGSLALLLLATSATPDSVPAGFAARVRVEVATRWSVDSAAVELQWVLLPREAAMQLDTPFHLTGRGVDGWLVLVVEPSGAPPQAVRLRAGVRRTVPSATRALQFGQRIRDADVVLREDVVWGPGASDPIMSVVGWEVRRDVAEGAALIGNVVASPRVIAAGDPVVFSWSDHGVRIERQALALAPARIGEMVQGMAGTVRLSGRATGPGAAQLKERVQ